MTNWSAVNSPTSSPRIWGPSLSDPTLDAIDPAQVGLQNTYGYNVNGSQFGDGLDAQSGGLGGFDPMFQAEIAMIGQAIRSIFGDMAGSWPGGQTGTDPGSNPLNQIPGSGRPLGTLPDPSGSPPADLSAANQHFLTQWGGTKWNGVNGAPAGYEDCGPTSGVMALSVLGLGPNPNASNAEGLINQMRDLTRGGHTTQSSGTTDSQMVTGLRAAGAKANTIDPTINSVDQALQNGPVIISGDPWKAWGGAMSSQGNYMNGHDPGNHFVTIMGRTADGQYIVGDPLSKSGAITVSAQQIQQFWNDGGASAISVTR
jgi:hypothetical protein